MYNKWNAESKIWLLHWLCGEVVERWKETASEEDEEWSSTLPSFAFRIYLLDNLAHTCAIPTWEKEKH